jgi:general secretion pathway protein N
MTKAQLGVIFGALLLVALILTVPLALVLPERILSARAVSGTIWSGHLNEAAVGRLPVGDVDVGIAPLSLLSGSPQASVQGILGTAKLSRAGIADATARLATGALFGAIPLAAVDLDDVTVKFRGGRCEAAEGRVKASFSGEVGGLSLAQGLSGVARCDGGLLMLPLVSQSAMERLNMRVAGDGSYRSEFIVKSTDPALASKLAASGFQSTQGGFVLRLSGTL